MMDWDKDVLGTPTTTAKNKARSSGLDDDQTTKRQQQQEQQIKEVNDLRQRDIQRRRQVKNSRQTINRTNPSTTITVHSTTELAVAEAERYAQEANQTTLLEIQRRNWIPYTQEQVKELFRSTYIQQGTLFSKRELNVALGQCQRAIYDTTIFVLPLTETTDESRSSTDDALPLPAMIHYPASSFSLLTLIKGLHNTISTTNNNNPVQASFWKFMLHRNDPSSGPIPTTAPPHTPTDDREPSSHPDGHVGSSEVAPSSTTANYHQSNEEYLRMIHVLECLRSALYKASSPQTKSSKNEIPKPHYVEDPEKTTRMASHLAYYLPNVLFHNLIAFLDDLKNSTIQTKGVRTLKSIRNLKLRTVIDRFYAHFVEAQLGDYLFRHDDTEETRSSPTSVLYNYHSSRMSAIQLSSTYLASLDYYTSTQNAFVALFMDVQEILYQGSRVVVLDTNDETYKKIRKLASRSMDYHDDHMDLDTVENQSSTSADSEPHGGNATKIKPSKAAYITNQIVDSLDESALRPVGFRQRKTEKVTMPSSHFAFEGMLLPETILQSKPVPNTLLGSKYDESLFLSTDDAAHPPNLNGHSGLYTNGNRSSTQQAHVHVVPSSPYSRMVFIDNLPIDICPERIHELYSRCGEIESVEIFNQRPDLDPGKLSKVEISRRRAKQTKMSLSVRTWSRPKTPVYGLLTFANESGSKKAADDSLRIFGMIIQRHPVRSIPSSSIKTLYIEDIPAGYPCVDFEYQLAYVLNTNNIYVGLSAGQNNAATVGSCEIKFPSFEIAYESSIHLQEKLSIFKNSSNDAMATSELSETAERGTDVTTTDDGTLSFDKHCRINWIATQNDCYQWWTRQYGFD